MSFTRGAAAFVARLAMLTLMVAGIVIALPAAAAPIPQDQPEVGTVGAIAINDNGDGWAWAYPAPQTFATNFLIRIEKGAWRIAASSSDNQALLPPELIMYKMAITADGRDGWAIGTVRGEEGAQSPMFWRLDNGSWRVARHSFGGNIQLFDIALSADGKDGWIVVNDAELVEYKLMRLANGAWNFVPGPQNGDIRRVAISPDGKSAWGLGLEFSRGEQVAWRRADGRWQMVGNLPFGPADVPGSVATDNRGRAWMLSGQLHDGEGYAGAASGERRAASGELRAASYERRAASNAPAAQGSQAYIANHTLLYLAPDGESKVLDVTFHYPTPRGETEEPVYLNLNDIDVDANGNGWAVGSFFLGYREQPGAIESIHQPALVQIEGDKATPKVPGSTGFPAGEPWNPLAVSVSPDGGHTWTAGGTGVGFGFAEQLREPWLHDSPPAAEPLPGPSSCWEPISHCMRGVFASYWRQHGGLSVFGYPITPEVTETIGGKSYTVQYTQRARFEHHPEFAGSPNEVLLGLLGNELVEDRLEQDPFAPKDPIGCSSCQWFFETGHNVVAPILPYWETNGGIRVFGLPRSEAFRERNAADGKEYLVQYFERNRIEHHPENRGTEYEFLLGLLGVEQFKRTYGYVP